jgi:FAD/FMN-containing dehydrogenase
MSYVSTAPPPEAAAARDRRRFRSACAGERTMSQAPSGASEAWSNWSGSVHCRPARFERPPDEAAVAARVASAAASGAALRVVGSGHSGTPLVATSGTLLSLDALAGIASHHRDGLSATVRAGTKLCDLGEPLLALGMAMENLGDIDRQALGGAVGTGTHGTGRTLGNLSSQVTGARLVDGTGCVRDVDAHTHPELLRALRVSLGALGVLIELRLRLRPAYRLHERIRRMPVETCLERLDDEIRENRHFEFFWLPAKDVAEVKTLNPTEEPCSDLPDRPYERIDWSARVIASERTVKFFEMEYAVPAEHGPECFRRVRARMQERHPDVVWPVEYRTVRSDDSLLSNACGRETVTLSIHQDGRLPYREFFEDVEPLFQEFGGRPHWGKIHTRSAAQLCDLYPGWSRFQAVRAELDPKGVFLNEHLRRVLGV